MAQFDADIKLKVAVENLEQSVRKVENAFKKIQDYRVKVKVDGQNELKSLGNSFKRLISLSKGLAASGGLGTLALVIKDLEKVRGVGGAIKSALGPIDGLTNSLGNFTESIVQAAASAPGLAAALTATTVAAVAFAPQIARAAKDTLKIGKVAAEAQVPLRRLLEFIGAGSGAGNLGGFGDAAKGVEEYRRRLFELNESVSNLRKRSSSLQDTLNKYNSSSATAEKIAGRLVAVNARLNEELREQADLLRRVSGVTVTELEASKGRNSIQTRQKADEFKRNQARDNAAVQASLERLEEAERAVNNARLDQRAEQVAAQNEKKIRAENNETIKALERRAQLEERIANQRSVRIARETNERAAFLRGNPNQYGEGAVGPQSGKFAADQAATKQAQQRFAIQSNITKSLAGQTFQYRVQLALLQQAAKIGQQITASTKEQEKIQRRLNRELRVKRGRAAQDRRQEAITNATIGGAFPLLFGQGIGTSALGAAGGFGGGLLGGQAGFAGSLVGSALGAGFDEFTTKAQDLAVAMDTAGDSTAALESLIGRLDSATATRLTNLAQSGQAAAAADLAFKKLADTLGETGASTVVQAGRDFENLGKLWNQFTTILYAGIAQLIQEALYLNVGGVNPKTGRPRQVGPDKTTTAVRAETRAEEELKIERLITQETQATIDKDYERLSVIQKTRAENEADLETIAIKNELTDGKISKELAFTEILKVEEQLNNRLLEIDNQRTEAIENRDKAAQRAAERAARKAGRAAERAAREAQRVAEEAAREQERVFKGLNSAAVRAIDLSIRYAEVTGGRSAAIERALSLLDRQAGYEEANIVATEKNLQLRQFLIDNLKIEVELKRMALQQEQALLDLERERTLESIRRQKADSAFEAGSQLQSIQAQLANPFGGDALAQELQVIEQQNRRYSELVEIKRQILDLDTEIASGVYKGKELENLRAQQTLQTERLNQKKEELDLLDKAEQKLLKQQQLYDQYGFIVDEVSAALSDSIVGLIKGTETVEQAFSRMFENIGRAFIDMATKMMAQQLFLTVLQAFGGGGVGKGVGGFPGGQRLFAEGGFVTNPTRAIVGEGGSNEYVVPENKMPAAMARWNAGMRGDAVVDGANGSESFNGPGAIADSAPISISTGPVMQFEGNNYVSQEEFVAGIKSAAEQGEARALRKLQMSGSTRKRIGIL